MNGIHDMGGMHGFGKVEPEPNEPPFHSRWEGRALALNRAMSFAKVWNIDRSRAAIQAAGRYSKSLRQRRAAALFRHSGGRCI